MPPTEEAVIVAELPNANYTVELADGRQVHASRSGKLRSYGVFTRPCPTPGDRVIVTPSLTHTGPWLIRRRAKEPPRPD
jgi:translation initiation factor IF-1